MHLPAALQALASAAALTGWSGVTRALEMGALAFPAESPNQEKKNFQSSSDAIFSKQVFLALHQAASSGIIVYVTILTGGEKLKEKKKKKDVLESSLEEK